MSRPRAERADGRAGPEFCRDAADRRLSRPRAERADGRAGAGPRGAGLLGAVAALLVFLLLLFAAVQVLFNLHANSMVTSAGLEAARVVAGFDRAADRCRATEAGDRRFKEALGRFGASSSIRLVWTCADPDQVRLAVTAEYPTVLPPFLRGLTGLGRLERVVAVRVESQR